VRLNGDDIVMRLRPEDYDRWLEGCEKCFLKVHPVKTLVHPRVYSINSAWFRSTKPDSVTRVFAINTKSILNPLPQETEKHDTSLSYFSSAKDVILSQSSLVNWCATKRCKVIYALSRFHGKAVNESPLTETTGMAYSGGWAKEWKEKERAVRGMMYMRFSASGMVKHAERGLRVKMEKECVSKLMMSMHRKEDARMNWSREKPDPDGTFVYVRKLFRRLGPVTYGVRIGEIECKKKRMWVLFRRSIVHELDWYF